MITLGSKMEKMLARGNGELTEEDSVTLMSDLKSFTGVGLEELQKASEDNKTKADVLAKVAAKLGTTAQNLEQRFLPEVLGVQL